jgi:NMD protein affecting ribosome stability and mRNA decay
VKKKMCRECLRELPLNKFPRMGKAEVCRECKFGEFNKHVKRPSKKLRWAIALSVKGGTRCDLRT